MGYGKNGRYGFVLTPANGQAAKLRPQGAADTTYKRKTGKDI